MIDLRHHYMLLFICIIPPRLKGSLKIFPLYISCNMIEFALL